MAEQIVDRLVGGEVVFLFGDIALCLAAIAGGHDAYILAVPPVNVDLSGHALPDATESKHTAIKHNNPLANLVLPL